MSTNTSFQKVEKGAFWFSSNNPLHFWQLSPSLYSFILPSQSFSLWVHLSGFFPAVTSTARALAPRYFISTPSSAPLWPWAEFLLLGSRPRASASSKVVVRGLPRVSGNNNVSTPIMKARIPTMSFKRAKSFSSNVFCCQVTVVDKPWQIGTRCKVGRVVAITGN